MLRPTHSIFWVYFLLLVAVVNTRIMLTLSYKPVFFYKRDLAPFKIFAFRKDFSYGLTFKLGLLTYKTPDLLTWILLVLLSYAKERRRSYSSFSCDIWQIARALKWKTDVSVMLKWAFEYKSCMDSKKKLRHNGQWWNE